MVYKIIGFLETICTPLGVVPTQLVLVIGNQTPTRRGHISGSNDIRFIGVDVSLSV